MLISVVIADDREVVRDCLGAALGAAGFLVVGTASDSSQALALVRSAAPDLLLVDGNSDALDAVQIGLILLRSAPACRVVVLADEARNVLAAMVAGVRGYLLWSQSAESIVEALRSIAGGQICFCEEAWAGLPEKAAKA